MKIHHLLITILVLAAFLGGWRGQQAWLARYPNGPVPTLWEAMWPIILMSLAASVAMLTAIHFAMWGWDILARKRGR